MNQRIQLASLDDQRNAEARETVRQRISWPANLTPANVTYHSRGHALLLGCERIPDKQRTFCKGVVWLH